MKSNILLKKSIFENFTKTVSVDKLKNSTYMALFVRKTIRWNTNYLTALLDNHLIHYPAPINLTYAWSFGFAAIICLIIHIVLH